MLGQLQTPAARPGGGGWGVFMCLSCACIHAGVSEIHPAQARKRELGRGGTFLCLMHACSKQAVALQHAVWGHMMAAVQACCRPGARAVGGSA